MIFQNSAVDISVTTLSKSSELLNTIRTSSNQQASLLYHNFSNFNPILQENRVTVFKLVGCISTKSWTSLQAHNYGYFSPSGTRAFWSQSRRLATWRVLMTISWRNSLWCTCSFWLAYRTRQLFGCFHEDLRINGACSLDCFTYKYSSSAFASSSFIFHGLFACFPSPFIDGVSWIKYFKRVFVFDVSISGQFLLSFTSQGVSHPGEKKHRQQLQQRSNQSGVTSQPTNHVTTKLNIARYNRKIKQ